MTDPLLDLARLEGVPSAVQSALDAVDAVLRDRGLRRTSAEQGAAARLAAARATARLESWSPREGMAPAGSNSEEDRWLPGSLRLYAELTELAGMVRTTPPQVFARAHAVLARGLVPDSELGRLRDDPAVVDRMNALSGLLTAGPRGTSAAPALVLAAVVHAELATVAPFTEGNGILARAVEHLILIEAGIDPPAVLVPESGHLAAGSGYDQALAGYAGGSLTGVRGWLLHCAAALTTGAENSPLRG